MENEAEHYLKEVGRVTNRAENGEMVQKAKRYLKHHEREAKLTEMASIDKTLRPGNFAASGTIGDEGRSLLQRRKHALNKQILEGSPPNDLQGATKDALYSRQQELESDIKVGMPTHEEMRRNPAGAVDKHRKWERANKTRILERQNILHLLNPDDDSKDLTNLDLLRPSQLPQTTSTFMSDAQIPGHFAMTAQAKDNWPLGEPKIDTPLKQAARQEVDQEATAKAVESGADTVVFKAKQRTPAQLAHAEKMKAKFTAMREQKNA